MKCPKCQREHTLKRAENNTVVCAACGSRFLRVKNPPNCSNNDSKNATRSDGAAQSSTSSAPSPQAPTFDANREPATPKEKTSSFSWNGRISPQEFLSVLFVYLIRYTLLTIILFVTIYPLQIALFGAIAEESIGLGIALCLAIITVGSLGLAGIVVIVLPLLAASAKRLRDAGLSSYWTLLHFTALHIPFIIFLAIYRGNSNTKNPEAAPQAAPVRNFDAPPFAPPAFDVPPQVAPFVDVSETPSKPKKRKPNPFSWHGRASQLEFFLTAIVAPLWLSILINLVIAPATPNNIDAISPFSALGIFISLSSFFIILLFFAVTPRRFRDAGLSPYWSALFLLVPALGLIGGADFGLGLASLTYAALVFFLAYYPSKLDDVENEENDVSGAVPPQAPAQPNAKQSPSVKYCVKCGTPLPTPIQEDAAQVNDVSTLAPVFLAFGALVVLLGFGFLFLGQELGLPLYFIAIVLWIGGVLLFACAVDFQNARKKDDDEDDEEEEEEEEEEETP